MKKLFVFIIAIAITMSLNACGEKSKESAKNSTTETEYEEVKEIVLTKSTVHLLKTNQKKT